MEQFVLGIFQEQLSKFIVGFRREQVNANLLNGKGEIRDVELNCQFLNEMASKLSPLVEFESVHVSKVSFYVSSWTNIRKAPILIDIEHVTANLVEPFHFLDQSAGRKEIQQITRQELVNLIQQGLMKQRGAYNLFDRILDNLTVEVASVQVRFQPFGKFKTRRPGPWTPPAILLTLANIRFVSVNEYGQEAPPEEVWRHNHNAKSRNKSAAGSLLIYKKCSMEYKIAIQPNAAFENVKIPLVTGKDNKMEVQAAIQRRIRDGEILSVQVDATIPSVEMNLPQDAIPHVAHAAAGVSYLLAKDREFKDPLVSEQQQHASKRASVPIVTTLDSADIDFEDNDKNELPPLEEQTTIEVNIEEQDSSSEDEGEEDTSTDGGKAAPATSPKSQAAAPSPSANKGVPATSPRYTLPDSVKDEPVIVMPNGVCIHEKISISVSIYDAIVKGSYGPPLSSTDRNKEEETDATEKNNSEEQSTRKASTAGDNGCFELTSKGCIVEAIWPKVTKEKGGYVQASVSYFLLEEKYQQQIKTLMSGGVQFYSKNPVESPSKPLSDVGRDETFPLYEDRSLRPDPLGLRHTFPAQAFGLKTTVDFLDPKEGETEEQIQVLHEIGVDRVDFVVDSNSWCRILSFCVNEEGGGFDPRWHSGNWSSKLTPDMLVSPSSPLNLDECLQQTKQIFLDENLFVSSDLFNVTARLTRVGTRVPACVNQDVKSCDVVMSLDEAMLLVSSALPRTMLSGRIGNSVNGDDSQKKGVIEFPNDVTDVAYELEKKEDPSNRQRGMATSRAISTFRTQVTFRGCSVQLKPAIEFYTGHSEPLLAPCEFTMIFCFEGEPPENPEDNLERMVIFLSMLVHRYDVNVDLDLLAASLSTLMYHGDTLQKRVEVFTEIIKRSTEDTAPELSETGEATTIPSTDDDNKIPKSLRGRRVLVRKQLSKSRESGGISVAIGIQIAQFRARLWRQNVVVPSSAEVDDTEYSFSRQNIILPAVNLIDCYMKDLEFGFEAVLQGDNRRGILKGCFSTIEINACDFGNLQSWEGNAQFDSNGQPLNLEPSKYLVEILNLRGRVENEASSTTDYAFGFRLEEVMEGFRRWSISIDLANGGVFEFRPEAVETLAVQMFEALLMPYDQHPAEYMKSGSTIFPEGTVGAILQLIIPSDDVLLDSTGIEAPFFSPNSMAPGERIEAVLQMVIEQYVPTNVDVVLFRSRIENLVIAVSAQEKSSYSFNALKADFRVAYFLEGKPSDDRLLQTVSRKDETWASLFDNYDKGLHHSLKSRWSLSYQKETGGEDLQHLVPPFNFAYAYAQSQAKVEMDEGLEISGVEQFDDFISSVRNFSNRFQHMSENMNRIIASVQTSVAAASKDGEEEDTFPEEPIVQKSPAEVAIGKTIASVKGARTAMNGVHNHLRTYGYSVGKLFAKMQSRLDVLRYEAFRKEKDRLAALAVAASQATGWLRIGTPGRTGQRGTITATLWPYWVVLRKGLMLVYGSPNKTQVVEIISLQGASLHQLSGGHRKRDLKRAFGLVERSGLLHLVTVGTDREYHDWVREMKRSISAYGDLPVDMTGSSQPTSTPQSLPAGLSVPLEAQPESPTAPAPAPDSVEPAEAQAQQNRFGRSLSRAVNAAKATKRAVSDRSVRKNSEGYEDIEDSESASEVGDSMKELDAASSLAVSPAGTDQTDASEDLSASQSDSQSRGAKVRNRLAATKSRFGSAMQKAREKGRAMAEKRQQQRAANQTDYVASTAEWQCNACTFLNQASNEKCEMCSTAKEKPETQRQGTASFDSTSAPESDFSDHPSDKLSEDGDAAVTEDHPNKPGMRVRFGAAVRSVAARGGAGSGAPGNRKPPNAAEASTPGAPSSLKMRDVVVSEPLERTDDPFAEQQYVEEILKRLDGNWFAKVKVQKLEVETQTSNATDAQVADVSAPKLDHAEEPGSPEQMSLEGKMGADISAVGESATYETNDRGINADPAGSIEDWSVLRIQVFQEKEGSVSSEPFAEITREFSDIYSLHTSISESVGRLPPPASYTKAIEARDEDGKLGKSLAKTLGLTALDAVRTSAKLLSGLLDDGTVSDGSLILNLTEYHAEITNEFLNSMISCELPIDGLLALTEFLGLTGVSTRILMEEGAVVAPRRDYRSQMEREFESIRDTLIETYKLAEVCQADLIRAESNSVMAERVTKTTPPQPTKAEVEGPVQNILNIPAPVLSSRLHNAVHDALMKVMAERDQSRAKYVAADVLHVHELEQERKKNKRLEEELESTRPPLNSEEAKERNRKKQMEANSDDELLSLCQQLSSEIAARTDAMLEIERLKEMRETERNNEALEKESLQEEIQRLKDELHEERNATRTARRSSSTWQRSFEDVFEFRKDSKEFQDRATL